MSKNILILGGSRFIGYFILCELIKQNLNVTVALSPVRASSLSILHILALCLTEPQCITGS